MVPQMTSEVTMQDESQDITLASHQSSFNQLKNVDSQNNYGNMRTPTSIIQNPSQVTIVNYTDSNPMTLTTFKRFT